ncbi:chlorophyllase-like protein [Paenibacillus taihuensis]|uniref:Chlorophyllase-like protein n=1 Tax=Paenibacillus taihuensis TaxID=1156355 RepID=A0A3D9R0W5_9BACL|nr:alpha/beta fold hydrolase [Paenibacillus taihuensis]REE67690.1 chlorophyllase-like protein [Paenibacillus taihuensis]
MPIGCMKRLFTDAGRIDPFAGDGRSRRFMVSMYYPSAAAEQVDDGAAAAAAYPIVLLSPGFGVERDMYAFAVQKLAASGFVVLTVGATYESVSTVFPNGEEITQLPELANLQLTDWQGWNSLLDVRVQDLTFVLNQLDVLNELDPVLRGRLNVQQVGIVGHSLGGAAAYHVLDRHESDRVKAGILLDPSLHLLGSVRTKVHTPVLLMRQNASTYEMLLSSGWAESLASETIAGQRHLADVLTGYRCFVRVHGANHLTFSDVSGAEAGLAEKHELIATAIADFMLEFVCGVAGQHSNRVHSYAGLSVIRGDGHSAG